MVQGKVDRRIIDYFLSHQEELLENLAQLIEIPSVVSSPLVGMPYGKDANSVLMAAVRMAKHMGFNTNVLDGSCMTIDYNDRPHRLFLMAHLDVVEAGDGWTRPPYALSREGEWVFGRGVADNKGACVALMYAMQAAREICPELPYSPQAWFGTAEEVGSPDLREYIRNRILPQFVLTPDALDPIVIGESAKYRPDFYAEWKRTEELPQVISLQGGKVRNAIPGFATATVAGLNVADVEGKANNITKKTKVSFILLKTDIGLQIRAVGLGAHIGRPELGHNAQTALVMLLASLPLAQCPSTRALRVLARLFPCDDSSGAKLGLKLHDNIFGSSYVNFTVCQMNEIGIRCKMDARGPLVSEPDNFSNVIDRALRREGFVVVASTMDDAHYVSEQLPLVQKMRKLYRTYFRQSITCSISIGASYAHYIPGAIATGVATPGVDTMLHKPDERMLIQDIIRIGMIYTQAILDICGQMQIHR